MEKRSDWQLGKGLRLQYELLYCAKPRLIQTWKIKIGVEQLGSMIFSTVFVLRDGAVSCESFNQWWPAGRSIVNNLR